MDELTTTPPEEQTPRQSMVLDLFLLLLNYEQQIGAFGELVDVVAPHAAALDSGTYALGGVTETVRQVPDSAGPVAHLMKKHASGDGDTRFEPGAFMRELTDTFREESWFVPVWQAFDRAFRRQPRLPIVLNSLLITSASAFEGLMANVATGFYKATPEALEAVPREKEKEFSLKDLKSLGTVDDAIDLAVSRRVEELLFGSFTEWKRFFQDRLKIELSTLARDWDSVQEVLQRRHVIVHNSGRASKRYVQAVGRTDFGKGVAVGDNLNCTERYLRGALDELLVLGTLLVCAVALKFEDGDGPSCLDQLQEMSYNTLVDERWAVAEALCVWGEANAELMRDKVLFRVNRSIATWRLHGRDGIREEVERWDVSALDDRFKFAKACLLDKRDEAFDHLATLSGQGAVTTSNLLEWPLLVDLRDDPRFATLLEEAGSSTDTALVMSRGSSVFHHSNCPRASGAAVVVSAEDIVARHGTPCKVCRPALGEATTS